MFKALGDPTRLRIFQFLRGACGSCAVAVGEDGEVRPVVGPTVGEVCCYVTGVDRITSTISEHLKELRAAGLIVTEKRGRHVVCSIPPSILGALAAFFSDPVSAAEEAAPCGCDGCC